MHRYPRRSVGGNISDRLQSHGASTALPPRPQLVEQPFVGFYGRRFAGGLVPLFALPVELRSDGTGNDELSDRRPSEGESMRKGIESLQMSKQNVGIEDKKGSVEARWCHLRKMRTSSW